jgi:hypothetical protein
MTVEDFGFMMTKRKHIVIALVLIWSVIVPTQAQDYATIRNPETLARRFLGYDGSLAIPPPFPAYEVGNKAQFWVTKAGEDNPTQIAAVLAASTPGIYIWVEEGLDFDEPNLSQFAQTLDAFFTLLRIAENLGSVQTIPQSANELAQLRLLPLPDVDNDPHFYILYAQNLRGNSNTFYNPLNSQPEQFVSGGMTNQHEMILVNTSASPGIEIGSAVYLTLLLRQFYDVLIYENFPDQAPWLREAFSWFSTLELQGRDLTPNDVTLFFQSPNTPLLNPAGNASFSATQLFLRYLRGRFGANSLRQLAVQSGTGLSSLERVLSEAELVDLATDTPIASRDVFADFVMSNVLNIGIGDGRFLYTGVPATQNLRVSPPSAQDQFNFRFPRLAATQFGTNYLALQTSQPVAFSLTFQGLEQALRLPIPDNPSNHFYWSGNGINLNTHLSRSFDLSNVQQAILTFDTWYDLANGENYGYVSVSDDDGQTWKLLPTTGTSTSFNPYGYSYGPGFTSVSNSEPPTPFPFLGIGLDSDGITVTSILADSPLQGTDVQPGDVIAGHDGRSWEGAPNLIGFLSNYKPGDSVSLYMQRGEQFFNVDVTLGKHPTRVFPRQPVWTTQEVDLSAYAGKQIRVQFDYVSLAMDMDHGIAIDNIAIPEIDFLDDAESGAQGWALNGFQQMNNLLAARYLVQYAVFDSDTPGASRVERLIGPADSATSGSWSFTLTPNELFILAISGVNDETNLPSFYDLMVESSTPLSTATAQGTGA